MTDPVKVTETSATSAPQAKQPKGNQLEGKRSEAFSTKQAADIFKGSLLGDTGDADKSDEANPPKAKTTPPKKDAKPKGQSNPDEATEDTDADDAEGQFSDDEEADDNSDDAGEVDTEQGEEGDDNADDADDDQDLHTIIVDGKEVQIPYEELVLGYQRQADYTKKTQEIAQERAKLQAEKEQIADLPRVKEAYQQEAGKFSERAELVLVALEKGFMPQEPSEELRKTDPAAYIEQKEKRQEALQFVAALKQEGVKIQQQAQVEHQKAVGEGRAKLLEVQPELQKPEVRGKLQQYVMGLGYTEDQMKKEADHRLFELAFKAMKWDDLMKRAANPNPVKPRPKVLSQNKARDDKVSVDQKRNSEAQNRHKRDHSVKSASAVIEQRIRNSQKRK